MSLKQSPCPLLQMTVAFLRDLDPFDYLLTCGIPCDQKGARWELCANNDDYSVCPTWNETIESYDLRTPKTWKQAKVYPLSQTWWLLTNEESKHCFLSRAVQVVTAAWVWPAWVFLLVLFWDSVWLCSQGWPQTLHPSASAFWGLRP